MTSRASGKAKNWVKSRFLKMKQCTMMKRLLSLIFSCFYSLSVANAQQLPLYTLDPELHGLINPASVYCGFLNHERVISGGVAYRLQWSGFPSGIAPSTRVGHAEYIHLGQKIKMVTGGYIQHNRTGITENTGIYGRFGYIVTGDDPNQWGVSVGLNFGTVNWQLKTDRLSLAQLDDPNLSSDNPSVWYLDLGFGIYAYKNLGDGGKYIYGGLSVPRSFDIRNSRDKSPDRYAHIYALAGFHYAATNRSTVEISTWVRKLQHIPPQVAFDIPMQGSFNLRAQIQKLTLGFGVVTNLPKFNDTPFLTFEVGVNLPSPSEKGDFKVTFVRSFNSAPYLGTTYEVNLSLAFER
jgi:hypothetical protein